MSLLLLYVHRTDYRGTFISDFIEFLRQLAGELGRALEAAKAAANWPLLFSVALRLELSAAERKSLAYVALLLFTHTLPGVDVVHLHK